MTDTPASSDAPTTSNITFADMGLSPDLLRAVEESGYTVPTPIQAQAIPHVLAGRDVLGIAQTGTGKTASFTLPMIEILSRGRAKARMPRTLILEPTRELAAQVAENFNKYGKYHQLKMALLIGGVSFGDQDALLTQGVDVLIATPGRLLDHFERGKLLLNGVQVMVVDEADRMLDMGFIPDIERIFKMTPFTRQTLFFSATMPPEIQRLTDQFLSSAVKVEVSRPASMASTINARIVPIPSGDPRTRRAALRAVLQSLPIKNGIIFCNRKTDVDVVAKSLARHGFDAAPIHGDLDQSLRTKTLDRFRAGDLKLLVASDVAARGLDIPDVGHVFNFEPPRHAEDYIHRIGRTGRAGRSGEAYTLVGPEDGRTIGPIEKLIGQKIETVTIEGVPTERLGDSGDTGGRGRRAEELRRERSSRKDRFRKRDPERPMASTEPVEQTDDGEAVAAAAPVEQPARRERRPRAERAPREDRPPREERPAREPAEANEPREERQPREAREPREERRPREPREPRAREPRERDNREREDRGDRGERAPVLGFGDAMPAFLTRSAPRREPTES
ncbi:MAG: DEAD/DEAH box helicase [Hyphomonadaceae bacterium]|nr:MAG: DEAD/DEAH box helicase [Caulobacteraceae bacterium]MBT9444931.1 DEAD/DEAH box helicase [Hyphomonadaceae bacterium]TPW06904.1 MAG: DEAD/DEAH box helicase [Alphaproteobacteria bacterium]